MGEEVVGPPIQGAGGYDMVPAAGDVQYRVGHSRRAGGCGEGGDAAFQRGDPLFKDVAGRVHQPGVDVAALRQTEAGGRLRGIFKYKGGGLINRHRSGAGGGIGVFLPDMQLQGFKTVGTIFGIAHR